MKNFYFSAFVLRKGIGEDNVDYSQSIVFPYKLNHLTEDEIEPFQNIKPASLIYNQDFETPYLPTGFSLKLSLISNWGDFKYIGFNKINLYDQCGNDIFAKCTPKILQLPVKTNLKTNNDNIDAIHFDPENLILNNLGMNTNNEFSMSSNNKTGNQGQNLVKSNSSSFKNNSTNNINKEFYKYWITEFYDNSKYDTNNLNLSNLNSINNHTINKKENNENNIDNSNINFDTLNNLNANYNTLNDPNLNTFSNFNNQNFNNSENSNFQNNNYICTDLNTLYFIFDKPITISYIEITNIQDKPERGIKEIQISLDENLIYKGNIKRFNSNSDKTTILFSSDNRITKLINLKTLNRANLKNGYIFKQIIKPNSGQPNNIDNNKNNKNNTCNYNSNKISTAYNNANSSNNFSPTFNSNNNPSNNCNVIFDNEV